MGAPWIVVKENPPAKKVEEEPKVVAPAKPAPKRGRKKAASVKPDGK